MGTSNTFPGDADAVGPGPHWERHWPACASILCLILPFSQSNCCSLAQATKAPAGIHKPTRLLLAFRALFLHLACTPHSWTPSHPPGFKLVPSPEIALPSPPPRMLSPCCLRSLFLSLCFSAHPTQWEFMALFICWGICVCLGQSFLTPLLDEGSFQPDCVLTTTVIPGHSSVSVTQ